MAAVAFNTLVDLNKLAGESPSFYDRLSCRVSLRFADSKQRTAYKVPTKLCHLILSVLDCVRVRQ